MKTINITLDDKNQLKIDAKGLILPELIQMSLAGIEAACRATLDRASEELKPSLEEDMYEMINLGASTLLEKLFPEIEARPDLTVDAIQAAEDKLFTEKGQEYVDAYKKTPQAVKDDFQENLQKANFLEQGLIKNASKKVN